MQRQRNHLTYNREATGMSTMRDVEKAKDILSEIWIRSLSSTRSTAIKITASILSCSVCILLTSSFAGLFRQLPRLCANPVANCCI